MIIAEEAELLIHGLRAHAKSTKTHLLTYSAPVTKKMVHFSRLDYFALPTLPKGHVVPQDITNDLGIFAGRLYMDFDECASLVAKVENTRIYTRSGAPRTGLVSLLLEWLSLRRKGQDIMHTPMGYVCQGRDLHREHPFFASVVKNRAQE